MKRMYIGEGTMTGIFSAIYDAWLFDRKEGETGVCIRGEYETELFCEYCVSSESLKKAEAVRRLIRKHMGDPVYQHFCQVLLSVDPKRADLVFRVMQTARTLKKPYLVLEYLGHPAVKRVFDLSRRVGNEKHFFIEILRFQELKNGVLYAEIEPENRITESIADHFADRFPMENWVIHDKTYKIFVLHECGKHWKVLKGDIDLEKTDLLSGAEERYSGLFAQFYETISIKERKNLKLQRTNLPLKYRKNMTEFCGKKQKN